MDDSPRQPVLAAIQQLKQKPAARTSWIAVFQFGRKLAWLEPVTHWDLDQEESIALLSQWRSSLKDSSASRFPLGREGTWGWLARHVLEAPDKLLFWVKGLDGTPIGTMGLANYDFARKQVAIDNLVRGQATLLPGVMYSSMQTLLGWTFQNFGVKVIAVQMAADNSRAMRLFERCGFGKTTENGPGQDGRTESSAPPESRGGVTMKLSRLDWMAAHRLEKVA